MQWIVLSLGEMATNCYLIWNEENKKVIVIDPADDGVFISEEIETRGLVLERIWLTHGHSDHHQGALDLSLIYKIPVEMDKKDRFLIRNKLLKTVEFGEGGFEMIKTPGHTPGSVCFYSPKDGLLFSGDTWLAEDYANFEKSYGSKEEGETSLAKLKQLPRETLVLPGHGESFWLGEK